MIHCWKQQTKVIYKYDVTIACGEKLIKAHTIVISLILRIMDQITSFNIQIESLLKNKEAIQKDVERYEATRLVLVSQINILKEDKASNQNDDNVVELKILETMSTTLNVK